MVTDLPRREPPLPCLPAQVRRISTFETPLPDGRVRVSRDVWFIDRRGEEDWISDQWIKETTS